VVVSLVAGLATAGAAEAAVKCAPPAAGDWREAAPAAAGMDGERLERAIAYGMDNGATAIRVYRNGCRVGVDAQYAANRNTQYESWSLAKSVTALVFGRAMSEGLVGPDDPLGSLLPEADAPHGAIRLRDLLTMTSGLEWNGLRDYNIAMPNRIQEALTIPVEKQPGSYWEYSQSGPALLAEAVERAVGEDFQAYAQRQLFGPLGIAEDSWYWRRDGDGNTQGFFGLNMKADDFARLGELMRRGGVWRGERLLNRRFVREAVEPVAQSGCYGWLIWVNAAKPCVGPRIVDRPVTDAPMFPSLPADAYQYAGLFGQLVTVFPSQGVIVTRTGNDSAAEDGWEERLYGQVLEAIVDGSGRYPPADPDAKSVSREDVDRGFGEALADPAQYLQPLAPPPLPPAGPARARAVLIKFGSKLPTRSGAVRVRLRCPRAWGPEIRPRCAGKAKLGRAGGPVAYRIAAGKARTVSFRLRKAALRRLGRQGRLETFVRARNRDAGAGATARRPLILRRR
jgi:CubicO group peptidase (beta-lactamase class C family)